MMNALVNADLPIPAYGAISVLPATDMGFPHTLTSLTHIDCYMDDIIAMVQGGGEGQHQVFYSSVHALKCLFPLLPVEDKDSVLVNKLLAGEGN